MAGRVDYKLTYEDYLRIPDDGKRHEIIDGEEFVSAAPATRHQKILGRLHLALGTHVAATGVGDVYLAPTDVLLSPYDILEPDLLFISRKRDSIITEKNILGPPDLAVEILSESSRKIDRERKLRRYELFGVAEYWIVDPDVNSVDVYRLEQAQYRQPQRFAETDMLSTPLLPGLAIELSRIFQ